MGIEGLDAWLNSNPADEYDEYDECWNTGNYTDQICDLCPYRHDCSAYDV